MGGVVSSAARFVGNVFRNAFSNFITKLQNLIEPLVERHIIKHEKLLSSAHNVESTTKAATYDEEIKQIQQARDAELRKLDDHDNNILRSLNLSN